jgi:hypothetical protein
LTAALIAASDEFFYGTGEDSMAMSLFDDKSKQPTKQITQIDTEL